MGKRDTNKEYTPGDLAGLINQYAVKHHFDSYFKASGKNGDLNIDIKSVLITKDDVFKAFFSPGSLGEGKGEYSLQIKGINALVDKIGFDVINANSEHPFIAQLRKKGNEEKNAQVLLPDVAMTDKLRHERTRGVKEALAASGLSNIARAATYHERIYLCVLRPDLLGRSTVDDFADAFEIVRDKLTTNKSKLEKIKSRITDVNQENTHAVRLIYSENKCGVTLKFTNETLCRHIKKKIKKLFRKVYKADDFIEINPSDNETQFVIELKSAYQDTGVTLEKLVPIFFDDQGRYINRPNPSLSKSTKLKAFLGQLKAINANNNNNTKENNEEEFHVEINSENEVFDKEDDTVSASEDNDPFDVTSRLSPSVQDETAATIKPSTTTDNARSIQEMQKELHEMTVHNDFLKITNSSIRKEVGLKPDEKPTDKIQILENNFRKILEKWKSSPKFSELEERINKILGQDKKDEKDKKIAASLDSINFTTTDNSHLNQLQNQLRKANADNNDLKFKMAELEKLRDLRQQYSNLCEEYHISAKPKRTFTGNQEEFFGKKIKSDDKSVKELYPSMTTT